jgi:hypothetical protein
MNKGFKPLFDYVARMDFVGALIEHEQRERGDLRDLVFAVEYSQDEQPGTGIVSVYRPSEGVTCSEINPALDNMHHKLWFIEDDVWRVERHVGDPAKVRVERFYALIAYMPAYRPTFRLNTAKPIISVKVLDLPVMHQYRQHVAPTQFDLGLQMKLAA